MTWNPDGIVVGEAFRDYVDDLRETHNHAAGGVNAHFSDTMSETTSDEEAQVETTAAANAVDSSMTRRGFAVAAGTTVAAAAGAGTVAGEEAAEVPDFSSEYTPVPKIIDARFSVDEHTAEMGQLDYVDNDGDVQSFTTDFGAVLASAPDDSDETHNPVSFHPSYLVTDEFTAFPRDETREDQDGEEEDVSALDAQEWGGDLLVEDDGDALVVESDGLADGAAQSATFDTFQIDSGEARKVLQIVLDVDQLEADSSVTVDVVDAAGQTVTAEIDPAADDASESTIATDQGSGIVFQTEIGELDGGSELDTLEEIVVEIADADATLKFHGLNLELDSEWSFGTRQVWDSEDEEVVEETLVEPSGRTGIVSLDSLTNQFTDATVENVEYDVEVRASEAPTANFEVMVEDVERGSYDERYHLIGGLELPGGLYEVEVVEAGELVDEVRHPSDVYRTVEYAHDQSELPTMDDVDDVSWTDATSVLDDGDMDDEVTLSTTVSSGDRIALHYDLTEDEEIVSSMVTTAGGGGAAALGGGGGFMSRPIGWVTAIITGVLGAASIAAARARSTASSATGR